MITCIILIILGFTQVGFCSDLSNITYDDSFPVCPVNFFRRKRAITEYTRWRTNLESTPEFLVKVLDDELTTSNTKPIVAINIQPVTKSGEKIIIGGVRIPPITVTHHVTDQTRDYTRFVPPTTMPVNRVGDELYLAPAPLSKSLDKIPPIKPKGRNSQRDESPPASPQFLARTPLLYAHQFAPIAPVAFTLRATHTPIGPTTTFESQKSKEMEKGPTRTSPSMVPTRTEIISEDEYRGFQNILDGDDGSAFIPARSILPTEYVPKRTSPTDPSSNDESENHDINYDENRRLDKESRKKDEKIKDKTDKDSDAFYNMIFYNDEDAESSKKSDTFSTESYDDKDRFHDIVVRTTEKLEVTERTMVRNVTTITSGMDGDYKNEDDADNTNVTENSSVKQVLNAVTPTSSRDKNIRGKRRQICNLLKLRQLNFNSPRTLPEIVAQMKQWAENSPVAKWEDITHGNLTTMENPIYMMIVDDPSSGQIISAKQTVMIVAGIQGRDHHAVAAAMYVLYQLIERSDAHTDLLTKYRFWIIPVFNPDGYDYSMTFPHRREWSKNLRQNWDICKSRDSCLSCNLYGLRCTVQPCYGVNLDRNFEYQWIPPEELRAEHPCGGLHAGARQLSEAETWALTHFLHEQRTQLFTFIAFKEGEVLGVMYPYSHTRKLRAFDHVYRQRASRAASAAYSISGRPYVAGQTSEFLPLYAGGIEDWVDGHLGIDNTYTIMIFRPTDSYNTKLITERVVHEAYAAMDTLLIQSVEPLGPPAVELKTVGSTSTLHLHCFNVYLIYGFITLHLNRFHNKLLINL